MASIANSQRKIHSTTAKTATDNLAHSNMALYSQLYGSNHMPKAPHDTMAYSRHDMNSNNNNNVDLLSESMGRVNLPTSYSNSDKFSRSVSGQSYDGGVTLNANIPHAFMYNGQFMLAGNQLHSNMAQNVNTMAPTTGIYTSANGQYLHHPGFTYGHILSGHSPMSSAWPGSRVPSAEMPSLITPRRDSSSSQENDAPGTPFNHYTGFGDYPTGVALVDRSPHSMYATWSTPSPTQSGFKPHQPANISPRLQLLVRQEPPIPRAVPAPYSPAKPLDRSLENINGVTNVYIRGLLPDTTDEILRQLAGRFGEIVSSKSIIDHITGKCKGFGFVKYHNFKDAEDCIRGFHSLGYETSFARESFYSQLKKLSDETNTNLYVSNLPKDMNEHELSALFGTYKVFSSRILRDSSGNGRGVGFARFESRDVCEDVIKLFDKTPITGHDGQEYLVQIRYADTQDQKSLKQQTTAARQYRTAEYESQTAQPPNSAHGVRVTEPSDRDFPAESNDFEGYLTSSASKGSALPPRVSLRDRMSSASSRLNAAQNSMTNNATSNGHVTPPEPRVATFDGKLRSDGKDSNHLTPTKETAPLEASAANSSVPAGLGGINARH